MSQECCLDSVLCPSLSPFAAPKTPQFQIPIVGLGTWCAGEHLCHRERLAEEALDLACTCHGLLVLLTQLIHSQDSNDILQVLVVLQEKSPQRLSVTESAPQLQMLSTSIDTTVFSTEDFPPSPALAGATAANCLLCCPLGHGHVHGMPTSGEKNEDLRATTTQLIVPIACNNSALQANEGQLPRQGPGGGEAHLEDLLHATSNIVVLLAQDASRQHTGCGIQRVHCWVDAQLSDGSGQHSRGIQVGECGGRGRICQIIGRHIDGLQHAFSQLYHHPCCCHPASHHFSGLTFARNTLDLFPCVLKAR